MTFLASVAAQLLEWIFGKAAALIASAFSQYEKQKQNEKQSQDEKQALDNAKTDKEVEDAGKDSLNHI